MLLKRAIEPQIQKYLTGSRGKILFIWGPRRSGKTTLLLKLKKKLRAPIFNFNTITDQEVFVPKRDQLQKIAAENKVILIDEVQNFPESTVGMKILIDEFRPKIIATGSSELRQKSNDFDSLAGRYTELYCLPLSIEEIRQNSPVKSYRESNFLANLYEELQIFGCYPEIYLHKNMSEKSRIDRLEKIIEAYVLKDIVNIYELKNAKLARDILIKIALQLGSEASLREIANSLQANVGTVGNYIEIFIKNHILIPLRSFKVNTRRAVSENRKLYFADLGIRNALIKDFRPTAMRQDRGGVFENFVISEIEKAIKNRQLKINKYFYREYGGREVDVVLEDYYKNYWTYEIKSGIKSTKNVFPLTSRFSVVTTENLYQVIRGAGESRLSPSG